VLPWKVIFLNALLAASALTRLKGDVSLSAEDRPPTPPKPEPSASQVGFDHSHDLEDDEDDEDDDAHGWLEGHTAMKFLLAGGVAGAGECCNVLYALNLTRVLS
jgi:solute carrier family 25 phosphate transporter 23/24/25/41